MKRPLLLAILALAALVALVAAALLDVTVDANNNRTLGLFDLSDPRIAHTFTAYRLPRILAASLIGAGLGAAGAAFQGILRNPLAEPYTLGISSGASLAAVIAVRFGFEGVFGGNGIGIAALVGSLGTVIAIYRLARTDSRLPPATLLLAGITIAMFCSAASLLFQYTASLDQVYRIVRWMMGGLDGVTYTPLLRGAIATFLGIATLVWLAPDFNALAAGEDVAASLGVNVRRSVALGFFAASLIVAASIALAGPIGFVGLIVPHALRTVIGPDHRLLIPASALGGAALLAACDTLAHLVLFPAELPVGVVTAVIGGPFFLYLLFRHKGTGRLWGG